MIQATSVPDKYDSAPDLSHRPEPSASAGHLGLPGPPQTASAWLTRDAGLDDGLSLASAGVILWDRWAQDNHSSIVLARSGAGKSYLVKLEVLRNLYAGVDVAVVDPEDEYVRLAQRVGGTVVQLGAPGVRLNPLDLPAGDRRPDALIRRSMFLHPVIAVLIGTTTSGSGGGSGQAGLGLEDTAALDGAILATYRQAGLTGDSATWGNPAPLLRDLAATLRAATDPVAHRLGARLAAWVTGSFKDLFDGPTTNRAEGHLVVWSLRHLADEVITIGTLLALDSIWRSIDRPRRAGRPAAVKPRYGDGWS